jgi:uncharacterized membrane protein
MISKASVVRHPIHPMLVPIPIGLWIFSLVCDIVFHSNGTTLWNTLAFYSLAGGIIGALLAAIPGLFDLYSLPPSHAKRIGLWHMGINLSLVTLYVINFLWRRNVDPAAVGPVVLSVFAVLLLLVSGWLGGELVYRHGIGVEPVPEPEHHKPAEREHHFGLKLHHRH